MASESVRSEGGNGKGGSFEAVVPDTGEVVSFEGSRLVLPGRVLTIGWDLPEDLTYDQWSGIGTALQGVNRSLMWWIGDWLRYGDRRWGQTYTQAIDETGKPYQALANAKLVADQFSDFSRRRENLSFSHHSEVIGLAHKVADRLLDEAERNGWSKNDLRRRVTDLKRGTVREQQELDAVSLGLFNVIYADPPWAYANSGLNAAADEHYPTMPTDEICAMAVAETVMDDAVLFLWVTNPMVPDALRVTSAWGFTYKTNFVWLKDKQLYGKLGFYNYGRHELLFVATKGSFLPEGELFPSVIEAAVAEHSRKPSYPYDIIESMYPKARRLEMFCRGEPRQGWEAFGNQVSR